MVKFWTFGAVNFGFALLLPDRFTDRTLYLRPLEGQRVAVRVEPLTVGDFTVFFFFFLLIGSGVRHGWIRDVVHRHGHGVIGGEASV